MFARIRYKISLVVGVTVSLALVATGMLYTHQQEQAVLAQNERAVRKLTESVISGLQSVMLAGSADIAQAYADRLKQVPEVADLRVLRVDGREAFRDNTTIRDVNRRRAEETFAPREHEEVVAVLADGDARLQQALARREAVAYYGADALGGRTLTLLAPIANLEPCYKCHGSAQATRGVLKLTTSLSAVERDVLKVRQQSIVVVGFALIATVLLTGFMMGRSVVKPIERVTRAMARVAGGEFGRRVPVSGRDELGRMALSFNAMTDELERTYEGLTREQNKLTTIIRSAAEGVVVTDGEGRVVLVNPAAEALLGKSVAEIAAAGLPMLLDDAAAMDEWLRAGQGATPRTVAYKGRVLQVFASTIHDANDAVTGSAVLLRDVTAASRLTEELLRLSHTDGLTGLFNRRHFDEILVAEYLRAQRSRRPLALVVCDVDHFKRFNDVHGHDQGDRVLKFVAGLLQADLRGYDAACRYGGEEFVLVLPDADLAAGRAVAERVRRMVEHSEIDGLRVTISLGVAALPAAGCDSPQGLFAAADAALYRAKQDGRNRVRAAADAPVAAATPA